MNGTPMTNRKTGTMPCRSWLLKSFEKARFPPTSAWPPVTLPRVLGTIVSCRVASACWEVAAAPVPASGTWISARLAAGCTVTWIGWPIWPLRWASCWKAVMACRACGAPMAGALKTTTGGGGPARERRQDVLVTLHDGRAGREHLLDAELLRVQADRRGRQGEQQPARQRGGDPRPGEHPAP